MLSSGIAEYSGIAVVIDKQYSGLVLCAIGLL